MDTEEIFTLQKDNIVAVPILHYTMEMASHVRLAFQAIKPTCVAVELAETMQLQLLHAASRLPDISIVMTSDKKGGPLYYMCEPCDATFEGLRSALEAQIPAFCIDLDIDEYPGLLENLPDPYAIHRIGLKNYYDVYKKLSLPENPIDLQREWHMARRLKELSLSYDKILFIGGMAHVDRVLKMVDQDHFPPVEHAKRDSIVLCTLTEDSCRDVLAEFGWISTHYEKMREEGRPPPDRQKLIFDLFKQSGVNYQENTTLTFPGYHLRNLMKFVRNYAIYFNRLMPDLFQILCSAKGCVDHNYAYEVWELGTDYPHLHNVDNLPKLDLSIEEVWGHSKIVRFHLKEQNPKSFQFEKRRKDRSQVVFEPPGPFTICSYPKEDVVIEDFGKFLQKKGTQILSEEGAHTQPFTTSIEDGIDTRETIRHWHEKKLYVKVRGKPPAGVGSVVVVFEEDSPEEGGKFIEKYPWKATWLGEHDQESDMALYATEVTNDVVGPGISRCEYGGFLMSYPPRRMYDVWSDPDYEECRTKAEVLLSAGIDYAVKPAVVYVASKPPRRQMKTYAERYGKKLIYIPIGQLSSVTLNSLRIFHVLDGHDKREIADEYIY